MVTYNYDTMDKQYFKLLIKCKELWQWQIASPFFIYDFKIITLLTIVDYIILLQKVAHYGRMQDLSTSIR